MAHESYIDCPMCNENFARRANGDQCPTCNTKLSDMKNMQQLAKELGDKDKVIQEMSSYFQVQKKYFNNSSHDNLTLLRNQGSKVQSMMKDLKKHNK